MKKKYVRPASFLMTFEVSNALLQASDQFRIFTDGDAHHEVTLPEDVWTREKGTDNYWE